ncbi:MAG TPA: response regulator transcription factor [candidate division Zixibacteria bacterium]|nr:response regulator transcription factor [candidate division Zixibacteria bacterium]
MVPIKVVLADDHTLFREGIRRLLALEKDILVVGEASRGDEVAKVVERTKPDVLLLDLKMPKGDVVQTLLEVKDKHPATKVLILTAFSEDENILNAAKGGARGYVLKGIDFTTLLQAIKTVHGGGLWVDKEMPAADAFEEIAQGQLHSVQAAGESPVIQSLTRRELEILKLVAEGLTNEEIGKRIFISEKTVKTHLTNIFDKLKVNNRFKAALMIMGHGAHQEPAIGRTRG